MVDRSSRPLRHTGHDPTGCRRAHRRLAAPAADRQAHRRCRSASRRPPSAGCSRRAGLSRLKDIEPAEPVRRYEREHPGEMIHIDIKKLGRFERVGHRITGDRTGRHSRRGAGWEFVHVCIDDASRIAFSQILPDEKQAKRRRLPQGRGRLLRQPRRRDRARHDRQRLMLQVESLRPGMPRPRPQAYPDKALHAQDH